MPVEPLNAVLREIDSWRQPTLMLVGNHDQVSVGGLDHALHPLAAACSAIHILDEPTLYRFALFNAHFASMQSNLFDDRDLDLRHRSFVL